MLRNTIIMKMLSNDKEYDSKTNYCEYKKYGIL